MTHQLIVVALALMTSLAIAQQQGGSVKWTPLSQLPVSPNARLTVEASPQNAKPGDPINLKLTLKNISSEPVRYVKETAEFEHEVAISREDGTSVPRLPIGNRIIGGGAWKETLAPGEEVKDTLEISKIFELTRKGKYYVRVWRQVSMEKVDSPREAAMSGVVTFVITE